MSDIEAPTREYLRQRLESDFNVYEGRRGKHKHGGERVAYDLLLEPKAHLVERGFDKGFVVVEVKLFNTDDKAKHDVKARDMFWQCVAYSFSDIELPSGELYRPLFVLYYIGGTGFDPKHESELKMLHHFVQRGGVGRLVIADSNDNWVMQFGGSAYFTKKYGRTSQNVGIKRQTGSSR